MWDYRFGIEIEFTGITRKKAAETLSLFWGCNYKNIGGKYWLKAPDNREWKFVYDGSIQSQIKRNGIIQNVNSSDYDEYKVEMVSPILTYKDIKTLQQIIRCLRKAGGIVNDRCGIHIHLDGKNHTVKSLINFINIIASKNDLLYKALQISEERVWYCKKIDSVLVRRVKQENPKTMIELENIWYNNESVASRLIHANGTRYNFLNLHSFFHGNNTVELRGFNSTLHAGEVRSYIVLALAMNNQALKSKFTSSQKVQAENDKFAMRTYLNRIGLIGDEFKNCRMHLCKHLVGSSAWRYKIG